MDKRDHSRDIAIVCLAVALVLCVASMVPITYNYIYLTQVNSCNCSTPDLSPTAATFSPDQFAGLQQQQRKVRSVNFNPETPHSDSPAVYFHAQKKTAVGAPAAVIMCPSGYVGQYCQYPTCPTPGTVVPVNGMTGYGVPIEVQTATPCAATTTFPIDSHVVNLNIIMYATASAWMSVSLWNPLGQPVFPYNSTNSSSKVWMQYLNPMVGMWTVTYQSAFNASCTFSAYATTSMTVSAGFLAATSNPGIHGDNPASSITEFTPSFFVAHANGLNCPGQIQFLEVYQSNGLTNLLIWSAQPQIRYNCAYETYFGLINCNSMANGYFYKIFGMDEAGNAFERTDSVSCIPPGSPTSPMTPISPMTTVSQVPTSSGPVLPCKNGGVSYNGNCVCPPYWNGTLCGMPVCMNKGTPSGNGCICLPNWTGTFCQTDMCFQPPVPNILEGPSNRTMAFVIDITFTMNPDLQQIKSQINFLVSQINQQNTSWISQYVLVTFTDTNVSSTFVTTNSAAFIAQVMSLSAPFVFPFPQCAKPVVRAVANALSATLPYGYVFVFTDGAASDYGNTALAFALLETTKAMVSFYLSNSNPCGSNFQTAGTQIYQQVASFSDGQMFLLNKQDVYQAVRYIPNLYSSGLAFSAIQPGCTAGTTFYFPIDAHTWSFTVAGNGFMPNMVVYDPTGAVYKYAVPMVNGSQYLQVYEIYQRQGTMFHGVVPGIWSVKINTAYNAGSTNLCQVQVRVQSTIQLFYGFTTNIHSDYIVKEPNMHPNVTNYMVAHMTNLTGGTLEYMNMYSLDSTAGNVILAGSALFTPRAGCAYEYYSQNFVCPNYAFAIVASGFDDQGYLYNRIRVAICLLTTLDKDDKRHYMIQ